MADKANAHPTKKFFLDMLTRDIGLEDAILDLVDNSIDSYIRQFDIDVKKAVLSYVADNEDPTCPRLGVIDITLSENLFKIQDDCGGISYDDAKQVVFRFGNLGKSKDSILSVYGIGLKRAIFKLGRTINIQSKTEMEGFEVNIDVDKWKLDDKRKDSDWTFPIQRTKLKTRRHKNGTTITVRNLHDDIRNRIEHEKIDSSLAQAISTTYALFLNRYVTVRVNGNKVDPRQIPIGQSSEINASREEFRSGDVDVIVMTSTALRVNGKWNVDRAGWYILCNGRVVVFADKTNLTDWGLRLPQFVSKYRGFIGIALLFSNDPESLPWTTTKRGINADSAIYQETRTTMVKQARPVLTFLNSMYPSDEMEEPVEREIAEQVKAADIRILATKPASTFNVSLPKKQPKSSVTVQYKAKIADIQRARDCLKKRSWSAGRIGKFALEYLLKNECPE